MKISILIPSLRFGLRYWSYIIKEFGSIGYEIDIFTILLPSSQQNFKVKKIRGRFFIVKKKKGYDKGVAFISPSFVMDLLNTKPNAILVVEYSLITVYAIIASKFLNIPVIVFQEHKSDFSSNLWFLKKLYRKLMLRYCDFVIANSEAAKMQLLKELKVQKNKVKFIPLLVPPEQKDLTSKPIEIPKEKYRPLFLFVGQIIPMKNLFALLMAANILVKRNLTFSLWIIGSGPLREALLNEINNLKLENYIKVFNQVEYESIGFFYKECDVFIMPTFKDYRAVTVLEAMRFGKPIIDSTKDGNAGDNVKQGYNGFVFNPDNHEELADLMNRFIESENLIKLMGERSAEIMNQHIPQTAIKKINFLLKQN